MPIEPKKSDAQGARTNFRPPWVREGPKPIPMPTAPWTLNKRGSIKDEGPAGPEAPTNRKSSTIKIVPAVPAENGTSSTQSAKDPHVFERPKLREVPKAPPKEQKLQSKEVKVPISMSSTRRDSKELPQKVHIETKNPHKVELKAVKKPDKTKETDKDGPLDKAVPSERNKIVRQESMKKVCPAPPPMPPMPPPPPPPQVPFERRESLTRSQLDKLESLRSRPRKRPDWGQLIKQIEGGKKLKKVQCNDRSQPLLPQTTAKGQFIYESEKANLHNQLLKQIQLGSALKHVKTNDRSKPILEGLRKFRRQMTVEEKIIKSMSMASMPPEEVEEEQDEMDDIDKVRDDLQSTKQMLALELRNKEAQIAENKRLLARLANLEAELEKFKNAPTNREATPTPVPSGAPSSPDDKLVKTLKNEAEEARKTAEQMEKKYHQTADELFTVKNDLDEVKKQNMMLERKLQFTMQGGPNKRMSISDRRDSVKQDEDEFSEEEISEEEDDGVDSEEKAKRRAEREVRLIRNKLKSIKNKEEAAKRERKNLRDMMKKNQQAMKDEKKKYKKLQKEVNKMAALMKDDEEDEDEEKEDVDEEEEETESEESETESESESSEEESESESEEEDATNEEKKENINARIKQHENSLNVVKKGNYMLKANVDRLQDDLNKQKEMVQSLQEDLDSVLSELG